jgi:hypothetical protein
LQSKIDRWAWIWLILGTALTVGAHMRWGLGAMAWIAPIPFLRYLRLKQGWKSQLLVLAAEQNKGASRDTRQLHSASPERPHLHRGTGVRGASRLARRLERVPSPVYLVNAGRDRKRMTTGFERVSALAEERGLEITIRVYQEGKHGFEILCPPDEAGEEIDRAFVFIEQALGERRTSDEPEIVATAVVSA